MTDPTFTDRLRVVAATPLLSLSVLLAAVYVVVVRAAEVVGGLDMDPPVPDQPATTERKIA